MLTHKIYVLFNQHNICTFTKTWKKTFFYQMIQLLYWVRNESDYVSYRWNVSVHDGSEDFHPLRHYCVLDQLQRQWVLKHNKYCMLVALDTNASGDFYRTCQKTHRCYMKHLRHGNSIWSVGVDSYQQLIKNI